MGIFQEVLDRLTVPSCDENVEKMRQNVRSLFLALAVKRVEVQRQNALSEYEGHKRHFENLDQLSRQ